MLGLGVYQQLFSTVRFFYDFSRICSSLMAHIVLVQAGDVISANIYRNDDKPLYKRGNRDLIAINVLSISLFVFAKIYYITKNRIRERKWNAMTQEVCSRYYPMKQNIFTLQLLNMQSN